MRSIFIMYMPGHAGNFILRLFALSDSIMPVLKKHDLVRLVNQDKDPLAGGIIPILTRDELDRLINQEKESLAPINRLENYKFSNDAKKYLNWQEHHRAWADYLDWPQYRYLNILHQLKYDFMFAIHPMEFVEKFLVDESTVNTDFYQTCFYSVELDAAYDTWVEQERSKLNFVWREGEQELFETIKKQYPMQSISLTKLLGTPEEFSNEYIRVCNLMEIEPCLDAALELRADWRSIRFNNPDL